MVNFNNILSHSTAATTRFQGQGFRRQRKVVPVPAVAVRSAKNLRRLPFQRLRKSCPAKKVRREVESRFSDHQVTESRELSRSDSVFRKFFPCTEKNLVNICSSNLLHIVTMKVPNPELCQV